MHAAPSRSRIVLPIVKEFGAFGQVPTSRLRMNTGAIACVLHREVARQYDFREVRLTSAAQRGLASSRPEPPGALGTNERGGQPWQSLAGPFTSVSMFTRTPSPSPTRPRTVAPRWWRWGRAAR